jgi:hypothetical protein
MLLKLVKPELLFEHCYVAAGDSNVDTGGEMKPPRSKLRGITRKGIVCETPRFLTLFPLQGNLGASSEESPDSKMVK